MILRRLGNKKKIAKTIQQHFPVHRIYIEPFFGAGGMFFSKPKAKYNILNDLDSDVFNLFNIVISRPEELKDAFYKMPVAEDLWNHWKKNKETEPIKKALRFLLLSNYGYMGKPNTMRFLGGNTAVNIHQNIEKTSDRLFGCEFTNIDFRGMFKRLSFKNDQERQKTFVYCDPPYLNTANNYESGFLEQDSIDLFDTLEASGCKWAMSEFDHPFILEQAKKRKLQVINIGERQNLKNRRMEILVVNYQSPGLYSLFSGINNY